MSNKENTERDIEKFVGIEIFSTQEKEGIKGIYKNEYKDFIVKEITSKGNTLEIKDDYLSSSFIEDSKDRFTTFNLTKVNKDMFEALREIANALKISPNSIFYSGLKDKCSISVQKMSIKGDFINKLKKLKIRNLFFRSIHPTRKPVKLGSNWGNNFTIVLRDIEENKEFKEKIDTLIAIIEKQGFPNYFGLQRFGTFRPNSHLVGRYLLDEDFEKAFHELITTVYSMEDPNLQLIRKELKKDGDLIKAYNSLPKSLSYERVIIKYLMDHPGDFRGAINTIRYDLKNLLVSAFQSCIFNKLVSLRVKKGTSLISPIKGDVISILDDDNGHITKIKYIYGNLNGLYDKYLDEALKLNRAVIVAPIIGYNTNLDEFPLMKSFFQEILEQEDYDSSIFKSNLMYEFEFKGSYRAIKVNPKGLIVGELKNDDIFPGKKKLRMEFSLPKGSYATMLLRELIK